MFRAIPSLMYHSVSRQPGRMHLSPELLDEQCRALTKAGWRGVSLAEVEEYYLRDKPLPSKSCLFTFDDGYLNNYVYAEPILRAHGHCGVIFPILNLLEEGEEARPNSDDLQREPVRVAELGNLHAPRRVLRSGFRVEDIRFCRWSEIRRMHAGGVMAAAPHSLDHGRVVSSLVFSRLRDSEKGLGFFGVPPYDAPWGMPLFPVGYALSTRGYTLNPELFDLVRHEVPQNKRAATAFLADAAKRRALLERIHKLPWLGRQETEEEFRARLFAEFTACRRIFAKQLGEPPHTFCWPWGSFCRQSVEEAERAGFRLFFCTSWNKARYRQAKAVCRFGVRFYTTPEKLLRKARFFSVAPLALTHAYILRAWRLSGFYQRR